MRMEVGVALLLKNPVNPFMHADVHALYEGTNSTQISWVEQHANKNIQALYVLLPLYILCTYNGSERAVHTVLEFGVFACLIGYL